MSDKKDGSDGLPTKDPAPISIIPDEAWAVASSRWINTCIRNSPISGSVEAWNHLGGVLPQLREMLETELRQRAVSDS